KCLVVPKCRAAIQAQARDAHDRELDGQDIALLARRIVSGRVMYSAHGAVGKRLSVERCSVKRGAVVPKADRVLAGHAGFSGWSAVKCPLTRKTLASHAAGFALLLHSHYAGFTNLAWRVAGWRPSLVGRVACREMGNEKKRNGVALCCSGDGSSHDIGRLGT